MVAFTIIIICLGQRYELPALAADWFAAWEAAIDAFPQADRVEVCPLSKGASHA